MSHYLRKREAKHLKNETEKESEALWLEEERERPKPRRIWPPPPGARCAGCGSEELASIPSFAVGAGVALRPYADDVLCRYCGHIAPPYIEPLPIHHDETGD